MICKKGSKALNYSHIIAGVLFFKIKLLLIFSRYILDNFGISFFIFLKRNTTLCMILTIVTMIVG